MTKPISQREARKLQRRVKEFEAFEQAWVRVLAALRRGDVVVLNTTVGTETAVIYEIPIARKP